MKNETSDAKIEDLVSQVQNLHQSSANVKIQFKSTLQGIIGYGVIPFEGTPSFRVYNGTSEIIIDENSPELIALGKPAIMEDGRLSPPDRPEIAYVSYYNSNGHGLRLRVNFAKEEFYITGMSAPGSLGFLSGA